MLCLIFVVFCVIQGATQIAFLQLYANAGDKRIDLVNNNNKDIRI